MHNPKLHRELNSITLKFYKFGNFKTKLEIPFIKTYVVFPLFIVIGVLVYWPVFSNEFLTKWDDQLIVQNYYTETGLSLENLEAILRDFYAAQYAPLNQIYYTILYSLFGYNAFVFHLVSFFIHVCNAFLIFIFISRILGYSSKGEFSSFSIFRISFITALIVLIHPFLVESVAWLSASKVMLYALFYLVALNIYVKFISSQKTRYYLGTVFTFILSLGAKEQAVVFPICLVLIDHILKRKLTSKNIWLEKLPFFIIAVFFGLIEVSAQATEDTVLLYGQKFYPLHQNLVYAAYSIIEYFIKCMIPIQISYLYPFPNQVGENLPMRFLVYPVLLLLLVVLLLNFWKKKWIFFGIIFFLIHIGLVCNVIPLSRYSIIADRYAYIASIGVFFLIAYVFDQILSMHLWNPKLLVVLGVIYIMYLSIYTFRRTAVWHDSDSLKKELRGILRERTSVNNIYNK